MTTITQSATTPMYSNLMKSTMKHNKDTQLDTQLLEQHLTDNKIININAVCNTAIRTSTVLMLPNDHYAILIFLSLFWMCSYS